MLTTNKNLNAILERLNPAQREATEHLTGPLLIIAGAGSGKTSVLTARIALLMEQGVMPERILALTFTKKAAEEMRNRIIKITGENGRRLKMGTFHSVFISYLRPYAHYLGLPNNFTIQDEEDSMAVLKRAISQVLSADRKPVGMRTEDDEKRYKREDNQYKPREMKSRISNMKNRLITAETYAGLEKFTVRDSFLQQPKFPDIFKEYCNINFRCGTLDFDDILLFTDILLNNNPEICDYIAAHYDYILVDEYQDTNVAQYSILQRLTEHNKNICVVGDDSQSIYAFRGARIENIFNFEKEYRDYGCRTIKLEQNYRSTKTIVESANRLIANNDDRIPKTCFAQGEEGDEIELYELADSKKEGDFIAETIKSHKKKRGLNWDDFAVLYRTNSQSRALEDSLVRHRIPYKIYSGTSFFERMEVKDQMAYFKLAVNPNDDESFRRIINKPSRGIGEAAQTRFYDFAFQNGMTLWEALNDARLDFTGLKPKVLAGFDELRSTLNETIAQAQSKSAFDAATFIMNSTGFYDGFMAENTEESKARADNIRELVDSTKAFEDEMASINENIRDTQGNSLSDYLQNAMLLTNADTSGDNAGKVNLMTVHCAKGLEYDTVFISGMEENLFPLEIDGTPAELEEERRLCYVAVTRAKKRLILTKADRRIRFGKWVNKRNSIFIRQLLPPKGREHAVSLRALEKAPADQTR